MVKKILVALDGSEQADRALDLALNIADKFSAEIVLMSVIDYIPMPIVAEGVGAIPPFNWEQYLESLRKNHEEILTRALNEANRNKPKLTISKKLAEGRPADKIIETAKDGEFDMIFMGSRGLGGIKEFFLGSVSDRVADEAPCPVVIVK